MYYIYEIFNKVTGRKYIGMTTNHFKRFEQHMLNLERGVHAEKMMQRDYILYGKDSFEYRLLEYQFEKTKAHQREIHYMKRFKTHYDDYGYNSRDAYFNKYQNTNDSINSQNFIYKLIKQSGLSLNKVAKEIGISRSALIRKLTHPKSLSKRQILGLCDVLDLKLTEILMFVGLTDKNYSQEEIETIWKFNRLKQEDKEFVLGFMHRLLEVGSK